MSSSLREFRWSPQLAEKQRHEAYHIIAHNLTRRPRSSELEDEFRERRYWKLISSYEFVPSTGPKLQVSLR